MNKNSQIKSTLAIFLVLSTISLISSQSSTRLEAHSGVFVYIEDNEWVVPEYSEFYWFNKQGDLSTNVLKFKAKEIGTFENSEILVIVGNAKGFYKDKRFKDETILIVLRKKYNMLTIEGRGDIAFKLDRMRVI